LRGCARQQIQLLQAVMPGAEKAARRPFRNARGVVQ